MPTDPLQIGITVRIRNSGYGEARIVEFPPLRGNLCRCAKRRFQVGEGGERSDMAGDGNVPDVFGETGPSWGSGHGGIFSSVIHCRISSTASFKVGGVNTQEMTSSLTDSGIFRRMYPSRQKTLVGRPRARAGSRGWRGNAGGKWRRKSGCRPAWRIH